MARKRQSRPPPGPETPPALAEAAAELASKHQRTLKAVFARPTRTNIAWTDADALLRALGAIVATRGGSMHAFTIGPRRIVLHRPHPGSELARGAVEELRRFLAELEITP